jgi:hypothetical protein
MGKYGIKSWFHRSGSKQGDSNRKNAWNGW